MAGERRSHQLEWLAALAGVVLIAGVAIATTALLNGGAKPHTTPRASATPASRGMTVSDSTPVIMIADPSALETVAVTWDGKQGGTFPPSINSGFIANPAATLFASASGVRDRSGKLLAQGNFGGKFFSGTWADDEEHFCLMWPLDNPGAGGIATTLKLIDARSGVAAQDTVHIGTLYNQTYVNVATCSLEFDRAVVVQSAGQGIGTAQYWVVQLSTGKILWTRKPFEGNGLPPIQIVSSRDGRTIAESQGQSSTLYGSDGAQIIHLDGAVQMFSWDGTAALTDTGTGNGPARIVRVSDGSPVWSGPSGSGFYVSRFVPQPNGDRFAVGIHNPAYPNYANLPGQDVYIVTSDGRLVAEFKDINW